jgi:hypothetical protein
MYVPVDGTHRLREEERLVSWPNINLPAGWLLNSRRMSMAPVPRQGREQCDEIRRRRFILLCALDSSN